MLLREGKWKTQQIVSADYLAATRQSRPELADLDNYDPTKSNALTHYHRYFWNNNDGILPSVPRDTFYSFGLYNNHVFIVPSLELVVVRIGDMGWGDTFASINTLLGKFVQAVVPSTPNTGRSVSGVSVLTPLEEVTPAQRRGLRERPLPPED